MFCSTPLLRLAIVVVVFGVIAHGVEVVDRRKLRGRQLHRSLGFCIGDLCSHPRAPPGSLRPRRVNIAESLQLQRISSEEAEARHNLAVPPHDKKSKERRHKHEHDDQVLSAEARHNLAVPPHDQKPEKRRHKHEHDDQVLSARRTDSDVVKRAHAQKAKKRRHHQLPAEMAEAEIEDMQGLKAEIDYHEAEMAESEMAEAESDYREAEKDEAEMEDVKVDEEMDYQLAVEAGQGCLETLPSDTKLMLMPIVPMYHGSTALESVFMSSPALTTLCSAKTWQCEARLDFNGQAKCIRENLLQRFSEYWDMAKPVLFEKGPRGMNEKVVREYNELVEEHQNRSDDMELLGMKNLNFAYVLMWRPVCLSFLSRHANAAIDENREAFALEEVKWLEDLVDSHKFLSERGVPVLVTNMGDMMWRVEESKARLEKFLPCLGDLNFNYVPEMHKDIFEENEWKAEGSIKDFGEGVDPRDCCGYDVEAATCDGEGALFQFLDPEDQMRAQEALDYLSARSSMSSVPLI